MKYRILLLAFAAILLDGCLYTSHHFNSGRILPAGHTAVTLGYGTVKLRSLGCDQGAGFYAFQDTAGTTRCISHGKWDGIAGAQDTADPRLTESTLPKLSLGYRLGVRGPWGPFTGIELGWHLEAPTNPGSAEFDLKFGLPAPTRWHHSASGGWIVGMWTDNSFFGEYALSRAFGNRQDASTAHALYASYRLTRLATQPRDILDSTDQAFRHRKRWANQATVGVYLDLPDWVILPDYVSPHATFSTPWVPAIDDELPEEDLLMDFNFGFGWRF